MLNKYLMFLLFAKCAVAARILMITLGGTVSHKIPFIEVGKALSERSHNVTLISGFNGDTPKTDLYREVAPKKVVNYIEKFFDRDLLGDRMQYMYPISIVDSMFYALDVCSAFYEDKSIHFLMKSKFDLAILDGVYPECALGWIYKAKIPFMYINTIPFYTGSLSAAGNPVLMAVTPNFATQLTEEMNFYQRLHNSVVYAVTNLIHKVLMALLQRRLQGYLGNIPNVYDISANVSFILNGGHPALTYSRPLHANVAEVACLHCRPAKPLPIELEEFIGAKEFIYVSLGSSVTSAKMPKELRQIMIAAFSRLPYQVLWKWETNITDLKNLPKNIKLATWFPQQDLLGHKSIKAFISQTGILSMSEAVYHGCPIIAMPVFCDQDVNTAKAVLDGYAIKLELTKLTSDFLHETIMNVAGNRKYKNAVEQRRSYFLDQMNSPLDIALFHIEYVLRHKGAKHLLTPSRLLSTWEYYFFDVYAFYGIIVWILWRLRSLLLDVRISVKVKTA